MCSGPGTKAPSLWRIISSEWHGHNSQEPFPLPEHLAVAPSRPVFVRDAEQHSAKMSYLGFFASARMLTEVIEAGRCLCIHAQLQAVDTILQSLLYQRGIVPSVVSQLLSAPELQHEVKFVDAYTKIMEAMKQLFRSCNRRMLHEVVVIIGSSCTMPQEIYRILISVCDSYESDVEHCGANCAELLPREQRRISSSLVVSSNLNGPRNITQNTRVFVFVRGSPTLQFPEELVEYDEGFELPDDKTTTRRKIFSMMFNMKHICVENLITASDSDTVWFRLSPLIRAFI